MKSAICTNNPRTASALLSIAAACVVVLISTSLSSFHQKWSRNGDVQAEAETIQGNASAPEQCACDGGPQARHPSSLAAAFGLHGDIADCCCSFHTLERTNVVRVYPLLQRIVATPFFAHFKVDLCSDCELWHDAPLCRLRDCGVCECERPPAWAHQVTWMPEEVIVRLDREEEEEGEDCGHVDDEILTTVDAHVAESWMTAASSAPMFFDESPTRTSREEDTAVVVDLRLNPERYTAYDGQSAHKVWNAIHQDNCFQQKHGTGDVTGQCTLPKEQRVYNRIISGMHSSISLHIAHSYCLEMDTDQIAECAKWGPNVAVAHERVLRHQDRLENLYVVFAVVLRAVQKAGPAILAAVPTEDPFFAESLSEWNQYLRPALADMIDACPRTFDEASLFADGTLDATARRSELQRRFRHLLQIMQCVGCDRCKLWGTLQALGVGTALRIILDDNESRDTDLSRQEAVALVHTLERFSSALVYMHDFQEVE